MPNGNTGKSSSIDWKKNSSLFLSFPFITLICALLKTLVPASRCWGWGCFSVLGNSKLIGNTVNTTTWEEILTSTYLIPYGHITYLTRCRYRANYDYGVDKASGKLGFLACIWSFFNPLSLTSWHYFPREPPFEVHRICSQGFAHVPF